MRRGNAYQGRCDERPIYCTPADTPFSALSANSGPSRSTETTTVSSTVTTTVTEASGGATVTPTTYIPASPTDVPSLPLNCQNDTVSENTFYQGTFQEHCGVDFGGSGPSATKDAAGNTLPYSDIIGIIVYSLSDCYQACLNLNNKNGPTVADGSMLCRGVTFNSELASAVNNVGASCWLKNGTPVDIGSYPIDLRNTYLSAALR